MVRGRPLRWLEPDLGGLGPFSLERRRQKDRSVSSPCIPGGGTWRRQHQALLRGAQQKDKRQQPQVAMGNGTWVQSFMNAFLCSAGAGAEGSLGNSSLRDARNLPGQGSGQPHLLN